MKHILSTDMLEGFEHVSTIASATNNGKPKRLEIYNTLCRGSISSMFRVVTKDKSVDSVAIETPFLTQAIEAYNEL